MPPRPTLVVTLTGFRADEQRAFKMEISSKGFTYESCLKHATSVLVAKHTCTTKWIAAMRAGIPVVGPMWLRESEYMKPADFSRFSLKRLSGLRICCTRLSMAEREELERTCKEHGAVYCPNLDDSVAVLLVPNDEGRPGTGGTDGGAARSYIDEAHGAKVTKISHAAKRGIPIVRQDWLYAVTDPARQPVEWERYAALEGVQQGAFLCSDPYLRRQVAPARSVSSLGTPGVVGGGVQGTAPAGTHPAAALTKPVPHTKPQIFRGWYFAAQQCCLPDELAQVVTLNGGALGGTVVTIAPHPDCTVCKGALAAPPASVGQEWVRRSARLGIAQEIETTASKKAAASTTPQASSSGAARCDKTQQTSQRREEGRGVSPAEQQRALEEERARGRDAAAAAAESALATDRAAVEARMTAVRARYHAKVYIATIPPCVAWGGLVERCGGVYTPTFVDSLTTHVVVADTAAADDKLADMLREEGVTAAGAARVAVVGEGWLHESAAVGAPLDPTPWRMHTPAGEAAQTLLERGASTTNATPAPVGTATPRALPSASVSQLRSGTGVGTIPAVLADQTPWCGVGSGNAVTPRAPASQLQLKQHGLRSGEVGVVETPAAAAQREREGGGGSDGEGEGDADDAFAPGVPYPTNGGGGGGGGDHDPLSAGRLAPASPERDSDLTAAVMQFEALLGGDINEDDAGAARASRGDLDAAGGNGDGAGGERVTSSPAKSTQVLWKVPPATGQPRHTRKDLGLGSDGVANGTGHGNNGGDPNGANNMFFPGMIQQEDSQIIRYDQFDAGGPGGGWFDEDESADDGTAGAAQTPSPRQLFFASAKTDGDHVDAALPHAVVDTIADATHIICGKPLKSVFFLGGVAGGKWMMIPGYLHDSNAKGAWCEEGPYEWNEKHLEGVVYQHKSSSLTKLVWAAKYWRERGGRAFTDMSPVAIEADEKLTAYYETILRCGSGEVVAPGQAPKVVIYGDTIASAAVRRCVAQHPSSTRHLKADILWMRLIQPDLALEDPSVDALEFALQREAKSSRKRAREADDARGRPSKRR